jgi:hypothetical protein
VEERGRDLPISPIESRRRAVYRQQQYRGCGVLRGWRDPDEQPDQRQYQESERDGEAHVHGRIWRVRKPVLSRHTQVQRREDE